MTRLLWDQIGDRLFEAGLDHGVLYLADGSGVPWNGLVSIDEDFGDDTSEPEYFDGVKFLDKPLTGDFSATLNAITYPDSFLDYEGIRDLGGGLLVDGQDTKLFGLSYRTKIGNDLEGIDHGYKIHLLYNLTAVPDSLSYETLSESPKPMPFSWKITSVPTDAPGYRPTAHVILDSRYLNSDMLAGIEDIIYGDADGMANLPSLSNLMNFVSFWDPKLIVPTPSTGLSPLIPGMGDLTQINVDGIYAVLPTTRLHQSLTAADGFYQLIP
jgi:hypothetical protein